MRYSFTGPSSLGAYGHVVAARVASTLDPEPTEVTTGGAAGWDTAVALAALRAWPEALHRVVLPAAPYADELVQAWAMTAFHQGCRYEIVETPGGGSRSDAYRRRNEALVGYGPDLLVAGVRRPDFYRSGEWMTINIAERAGVPVRFEEVGA